MPLPQRESASVNTDLAEYWRSKVPVRLADKLRLGHSVRGNSVTLFEERPNLLEADKWVKILVAQFRYDPSKARWSLHCADRNSRWHLYEDLAPAKDFALLLREVEEDPTGIFWG